MPAQLSFFDMEASVTLPAGFFPPVPVTVGPNWQPGDIRVFCQNWYQPNSASGSITWYNPPGYTTVNTELNGNVVNGRFGASWRRLQPGDTDTFISYIRPDGFKYWNSAIFTVRGVDPNTAPSIQTFQIAGPTASGAAQPPSTIVVSSVAVPSAGTVVTWMACAGAPALPGGSGLGVPSGWTNLVATDGSGPTYNPYLIANASIAVAKSFSSSGSTGNISFAMSNSIQNTLFGTTIFFKAAPDVSITATAPPSTVATATAATLSTSTAVDITTGSASTTATATTAFNPLYGVWVSDPLTLTGNPVTGSVVRWANTQPLGTTVTVQTSINNGASWDNATVNSVIPRLATGDTATRSVLVRAILTRTNATDPPPHLLTLEVQVSVDAGTDELVPIGHGMIDKVTTSAVGGSTGTGSATNVVSSTAVTSRGGGQTGGGTSIKVHVTDLSGSIKRNVWASPFTLPSGLNYGAAAKAMVLNRLPSQADFAIASTQVITPLLVYGLTQGGDPWQDIQDLATAIGFEAFFDASGVFTFRPVPDPNVGDPVWVFDEDANPLVSEASRELSSDQTFNHVIVVGQSTSSSNPVSAEAFDNNPSSPTYILGDYGEVTERLTFSLVTTQDQAQATANALLNNSLGAADTVTIAVVPMPALEPGDIIKINVSDVKANGTYMINSMTTSLSPADPQQLVCFRQSTNT